MSKIIWKPGNMLYPLPAVLVSCGDCEQNYNIITIAWTGTICTDPPMTYISVRPNRYSYEIIKKTKEFVINIPTEQMVKAVDYCGVRSGKDNNKFEDMKLTYKSGTNVKAPIINESPINIECKVTEIKELGSHHMFIAKVVSVNIEEEFLDEKGKFHMDKILPICYSHGSYYGLKKNPLGFFGYSVMKKKTRNKRKKK